MRLEGGGGGGGGVSEWDGDWLRPPLDGGLALCLCLAPQEGNSYDRWNIRVVQDCHG